MTDIVFYDFDFNLKGIFPKHISLNATHRFCGYGEFELHMPITEKKMLDMLSAEEYLICIYDGGQAIVTGWRIDDDIAIFGKSIEWLMTKRIISNLSLEDKTAEQMARHVVNTAMGDFVTLGATLGGGTAKSYSTNRPRTVYDVVCELMRDENSGFKLFADLNQKQFVFEIYGGAEKSLMFSQSGKTAHGVTYVKELQERVTGCLWYEKKTMNSDGKETTVWDYVNSGEQTGAKQWSAIVSGIKTHAEASLALKEKTIKECIECETRRVEYGTDYILGDIIRLQFEYADFRRFVKRRVVEVEIYSEGGICGVRPILKSE